MESSSILYVNYAPYGNAGHILDYLKESFKELVYVSFIFHPVEPKSKVEIYRHHKLIKKINLPTLLVPKDRVHNFAFLLSIIVFWELLFITVYIFFKCRIKPHVFFAPNAFLIAVGFILRSFHAVDKVVFWVWDYYPVPESGLYRKLFYGLYEILDKWCISQADFIWFLSRRLKEIREHGRPLSCKGKVDIVPLGMKVAHTLSEKNSNNNTLGFLGVLKKSQGLELVLGALDKFADAIPHFKFEIIGTGPDIEYFKRIVAGSPVKERVAFYGFVSDENHVHKIVASWTAALALYIPNEVNLSAYADPSKVKFYLECGTPVIITDVPLFATEIRRQKAGIVIGYDTQQLLDAVRKLFPAYSVYRKNALQLAAQYHYSNVYAQAFGAIDNKK